MSNGTNKKTRGVSYSKQGYSFIASSFLAFAAFSLVPLIPTFYNSPFENYWVGLTQVDPRFVGLQNYNTLFSGGGLAVYADNTAATRLVGLLSQIIFSLLLTAWFISLRLHLRTTGFFKTVICLPNLIMTAVFSMLLFVLFSDSGPINSILISMGMESPYRSLTNVWSTRELIALMNFLMWYDNTMILPMAAILGIDMTLFGTAEIGGATAFEPSWKITLPLIRPISVYVLITSLIGGIRMFNAPQILTSNNGNPSRTSLTSVMYLNKCLLNENMGMADAASMLLFAVSAVLGVIVYFSIREKKQPKGGAGK